MKTRIKKLTVLLLASIMLMLMACGEVKDNNTNENENDTIQEEML